MPQASISGMMVLGDAILVSTGRVFRSPNSPVPLNRWINDLRSVSLSLFPDADAAAPVRRMQTRTSSLRGIKGTYGRVADVGSGNVKIHGRPGILTACRKFPSSQSWNGARRRLFTRREFFLASSRLIVNVILLRVVAAARDATRSLWYYSSARYGEFTVLLRRYEGRVKKKKRVEGISDLARGGSR